MNPNESQFYSVLGLLPTSQTKFKNSPQSNDFIIRNNFFFRLPFSFTKSNSILYYKSKKNHNKNKFVGSNYENYLNRNSKNHRISCSQSNSHEFKLSRKLITKQKQCKVSLLKLTSTFLNSIKVNKF
jgi:hypothetical protein